MCTDIWDIEYEVMRTGIDLDMVNIPVTGKVKAKPTSNDAGLITYSN